MTCPGFVVFTTEVEVEDDMEEDGRELKGASSHLSSGPLNRPSFGRHEDAWNILVHARMLRLAVGSQQYGPDDEEEGEGSPPLCLSF